MKMLLLIEAVRTVNAIVSKLNPEGNSSATLFLWTALAVVAYIVMKA
ncbi:MAG: hypothetical protein AB7F40_10305 [Victivallaceae bacterium]|nr:hypothetical protein [Victivallaceae bacterium]